MVGISLSSPRVRRFPTALLAAALVLLLAPAAAAQSNVGSGISGTVTFNGDILPGVLVSVSGSGEGSGTTDERGGSYLVILPAGQYTVTPSKAGYVFEPVQRSVEVADSVVNGVDFTASLDPCTVDNDGDSVMDCNDACPSDPAKTAVGICGCGAADTDSDGDGVSDCIYEDTPLACGEQPTVTIEERLITDNEELGELTLANVRKLKGLIGAVAKRYGGKEGARLRRLARSYERAVAKVDARTRTLVEQLPTILVPCPGQSGSAEVSNAAAKSEMRTNTDDLRRISLRVLTRLVFYQLVRYPLAPPSPKKIAKIKARRQATKAEVAEIYGRIVTLIDKVPDLTVVSQ